MSAIEAAKAAGRWYRTQIGVDERIATAAKGDTSGRWQRGDCHAVETAEPDPWDIIVYSEGSPTEDQADHIVRQDPARALREVAAKRSRIERHTLAILGSLAYCEQCSDGQPNAVTWPCPDLIDDMAVYADRPGSPLSFERYCIASGRPVINEGDRCLDHGAALFMCSTGLRLAQCTHPHRSPNHPTPTCAECGRPIPEETR